MSIFAAPNFYNQADQNIYNQGYSFIPQEMYRGGAFNMPTVTEENNPTGITTLSTAMNMGGGGGGGNSESVYTGNLNNLTSDFFNTISDRQDRLNNPSDKFLGFNTMKDQQLTGADLGEFIGSNTSIPQEPTMMGKVQSFLTPQSAQNIIEDGYKPSGFTPGIFAAIAGQFDKYKDLPRGDQAFIARNMGYTGPTVFGENTTGLSQDMFGLNTRSAFGNYAERVGKEYSKLGDALSSTGAIGGKADYQGATFNPSTGMFEADDDTPASIAAAAKANQMTKMVRSKFNYYGIQTEQRDADRKAAAEKLAAEAEAAMQQQAFKDAKARQLTGNENTPTGGGDGQSGGNYTGGAGFAAANTYGGSGTKDDMGADNFAFQDGGRVPYMMGGLANLVDIYD